MNDAFASRATRKCRQPVGTQGIFEVQARQENGYKRILAEAKFPLVKPFGTTLSRQAVFWSSAVIGSVRTVPSASSVLS